MPLTIEVEREDDGRWLAEILELPGLLAYGQTREEVVDRAQALSLRGLADRIEHGEPVPHNLISSNPIVRSAAGDIRA
jgi:predicted RNase H-like HicB family nuclease